MITKNSTKFKESKNKITPGLYIVSTPLGNKLDITLRAIDILNRADLMLCEDTRTTKNLFKLLDMDIKNKKWISYNDFSSESTFPLVLKEFLKSKVICLVSDAGTPLISDPG